MFQDIATPQQVCKLLQIQSIKSTNLYTTAIKNRYLHSTLISPAMHKHIASSKICNYFHSGINVLSQSRNPYVTRETIFQINFTHEQQADKMCKKYFLFKLICQGPTILAQCSALPSESLPHFFQYVSGQKNPYIFSLINFAN